MVGTVLYPLNELEHVVRDAWLRERAKYAGREHVLEMRVPPLDCLWNDVLHLSPVHAADIVAELRKVGLEPLRTRFLEIDPLVLDPRRTVVFVNSRADRLDESQWMPLNPVTLSHFADSTGRVGATSARAPQMECGRAYGAIFPHVLYRGSLETSGWPIVDV